MMRPPPTITVRGTGAQRRRVNFKWIDSMSEWLHKAAHNLTFKSIPFVALSIDAENIWGYLTPKQEQEHLENKIRSRDKVEKEGRVVR